MRIPRSPEIHVESKGHNLQELSMDDWFLKFPTVLWIGAAGKTQVEQSPKSLVVLQGENCILHCNYTVSPANNLRWYKQDTGRGIVSLAFMTYIENKKSNGRYSAILDADAKNSTLHITAAQLEDTAFYICVVGAPCFIGTCSQYQNLFLEASRRSRWQSSLFNTALESWISLWVLLVPLERQF